MLNVTACLTSAKPSIADCSLVYKIQTFKRTAPCLGRHALKLPGRRRSDVLSSPSPQNSDLDRQEKQKSTDDQRYRSIRCTNVPVKAKLTV